jgi:putative two-component system response regulator
LASESCRDLEIAARLHDIGKVALPDRILFTSEELKEAERSQMRSHAEIGAEILGKSRFVKVQLAEQVARHHHEWWDGTGYPSRLSGKRIPIQARIVALADVFDALTHGRPYAPAWPIDRALLEIGNRRGKQFDPELSDLFVALVQQLAQEHDDLDAHLVEGNRNSPFLQARNKIRVMLEGTGRANEKTVSPIVV